MKILIANSVVLKERAEDGARQLTISSSTESIIVELSPQLWEKLGDTAKWFKQHTRSEEREQFDLSDELRVASEKESQ